jgi:hypothetical protein
MAALEGCQDWQGLQQWLQQDVNVLHYQQCQAMAANQWQAPVAGPRQQDQLWQHLEPSCAFEAVKHAARLAAKLCQMQQRSATALQTPAAMAGQNALPASLKQPLQHLLVRASVAVCTPGAGSADMACLLRALLWLRCCSSAQEKQLGHQLLQAMCAPLEAPASTGSTGHAGARLPAVQHTRPPPPLRCISNQFLLADVAVAVTQLQLTPCSTWVSWFWDCSLHVLQQLGEEGMLQHWFLLTTIGLAVYLQTCQPQSTGHKAKLQLADDRWYNAWIAAVLQVPTPFSSSQLACITAAASQLDRQLPGIVQVQYLADAISSSCVGDVVVAAAQNMHVPDTLQVLQALQEMCQLQQQAVGLPVAQHWLTAAAALLPRSMTQAVSAEIAAVETATVHDSDAAADRSAAGEGVPVGVLARAQLQQAVDAVCCLVTLKWRGASSEWCQSVWESLLLAATTADNCYSPPTVDVAALCASGAGVMPLQEQQQDERLAFQINQDLVECFVQVSHSLAAASSLASSTRHSQQQQWQQLLHKQLRSPQRQRGKRHRQRQRQLAWHQLSSGESFSAASVAAEKSSNSNTRRAGSSPTSGQAWLTALQDVLTASSAGTPGCRAAGAAPPPPVAAAASAPAGVRAEALPRVVVNTTNPATVRVCCHLFLAVSRFAVPAPGPPAAHLAAAAAAAAPSAAARRARPASTAVGVEAVPARRLLLTQLLPVVQQQLLSECELMSLNSVLQLATVVLQLQAVPPVPWLLQALVQQVSPAAVHQP